MKYFIARTQMMMTTGGTVGAHIHGIFTDRELAKLRLMIMRYEPDTKPTHGEFKKTGSIENSYADILEVDAEVKPENLYIVFSGGEGMTQYYDGMVIHGLAGTFLEATKLLDTREGFAPRGDPFHRVDASHEFWRYFTHSAALHLYIVRCTANSFMIV